MECFGLIDSTLDDESTKEISKAREKSTWLWGAHLGSWLAACLGKKCLGPEVDTKNATKTCKSTRIFRAVVGRMRSLKLSPLPTCYRMPRRSYSISCRPRFRSSGLTGPVPKPVSKTIYIKSKTYLVLCWWLGVASKHLKAIDSLRHGFENPVGRMELSQIGRQEPAWKPAVSKLQALAQKAQKR